MQPESPDDAQVLFRQGRLTWDEYDALGDRDRHNLAYLLRLSDQYANGERVLVNEMRPLARVPYDRRSLIRGHVFAATVAALPVLAALLLPAVVFIPLATVFAVVLIAAVIVRHE